MAGKPKKCEICKTRFTPHVFTQRTCSKECGKLRRRITWLRYQNRRRAKLAENPTYRQCPVCGVAFVAGIEHRATCSTEC